MSPTDDINETASLRAEIDLLRAELEHVRRDNEHRSTRRGMLRLAGAAAVGAAAAAVGSGAHPAAALDGAGLLIGVDQRATSTTTLGYGTAANVPGAALPTVVGPTSKSAAILKVETDHLDTLAIQAEGSYYGIQAGGAEAGVVGFRGRYNFIAAANDLAAMRIQAVTTSGAEKTPPPSRTEFHFRGELDTDNNGDLWWCVENGQPARWKKITGPTSAGSFHAIDPTRVYDSRAAAPAYGALSGGGNRVVSIKDARPDASGAVSVANVVPVGASAIAYNLTIANTVGNGFLSVNPGNATGYTASSINWSATGQLLANGLVVKIDDARQVRVFAGGNASTDFIIDVLGYYL